MTGLVKLSSIDIDFMLTVMNQIICDHIVEELCRLTFSPAKNITDSNKFKYEKKQKYIVLQIC